MIKLVLFDAVGVLFPLNKVVGDDLSAAFHLSEQQLRHMWDELYPDYTVGKLTTAQFLDQFTAMYDLPREKVTESVFLESFLRALAPMPGMQALLQKLHKADVRMAMLSDTTPMFAHVRRNWIFSEFFDHIFLSFEIGHKKPAKQAFLAVIDHYHIKPEEIFFIDDNEQNVAAAKRFGLQAVQFTDAATLAQALAHAGVPAN